MCNIILYFSLLPVNSIDFPAVYISYGVNVNCKYPGAECTMSSLFLFGFLVLLSLSSANILSNSSFEEGFGHWKCKERPNLWNIVDPSPELLSISVERSSTGTKSFQIIGATSGSSERAVFASQFVSNENLRSKSSTNSALVIEWASLRFGRKGQGVLRAS